MDIKDFILIGGGILITLVVGHGFWIAWRAKREPLRLDIVADLIPDDIDEIERLRGELPNGGARVVQNRGAAVAPENLELDLAAPVLMEPAEPQVSSQRIEPKKLRPKVHQAPPRTPLIEKEEIEEKELEGDLLTTRAHVREVELNPEPIVAEAPAVRRAKTTPAQSRAQAAARNEASRSEESDDGVPVEELLIVNILAPRGERFEGEGLVNALRAQGLRYGDMNIFHRIEPTTKAKLYSVANAVEPGTFDLSDLGSMRSPGMTFFLQLPGPDDASTMFEDMLEAARNVAIELGGELRDENLSVLTGQTKAHMRQRITEFTRRRLSKRA